MSTMINNETFGMIPRSQPLWTRRTWMQRNVVTTLAVTPISRLSKARGRAILHPGSAGSGTIRPSFDALQLWDRREELALRAVDAAKRAGAQYADARLTRTVQHYYNWDLANKDNRLTDIEIIGIGVRALVNGYWGFSASPNGDVAEVEELARDAVSQATINAQGAVPHTVELAAAPAAVGSWSTPVAIDPFSISVEEKAECMRYWDAYATTLGFDIDVGQSYLLFVREERVVANSEGSRFTQKVFESGGQIRVAGWGQTTFEKNILMDIPGKEMAGVGWELFGIDRVCEELRAMPGKFKAYTELNNHGEKATIGRYTLVCDGATIAALLNMTLGVATQLDRALGYEANEGGTSFIDDPLAMVGSFPVASPIVNITANRSAPTQLATVQWDDEGVIPSDTTLVKAGVLHDFQTTREQASWLAPYYTKLGQPVRSNGCAAAETGLRISLQHMPNLALEPGSSTVQIADLVANVQNGILIEGGEVREVDSQVRNGLLSVGTGDRIGTMRRIRNGRIENGIVGGAVYFNTLDFWKHIVAVGGASTQMTIAASQYPNFVPWVRWLKHMVKGEPRQTTSHSVRAPAATIANQAFIDPIRKV